MILFHGMCFPNVNIAETSDNIGKTDKALDEKETVRVCTYLTPTTYRSETQFLRPDFFQRRQSTSE